MESQASTGPGAVLQRMQAAQNQRDLEAFVGCFAAEYESEQPIHPDVAFQGREQVRKNWSAIFKGVPDFQSELLSSAISGDTAWAEWHWHGTRIDGKPLNMRGVTLFGVQGDHIAWSRLYMEPVQVAGPDIDAQVQNQVQK